MQPAEASQLQAAISTSQYQHQFAHLPVAAQHALAQPLPPQYAALAVTSNPRHEAITPPSGVLEYSSLGPSVSGLIKVEPKGESAAAAQFYANYAATSAAVAAAQPLTSGVPRYGGASTPTTDESKLLSPNESQHASAPVADYAPAASKTMAFHEWQDMAARGHAQYAAAVPMTTMSTASSMPPPAHTNGAPSHVLPPYAAATSYNGWENPQYLPQQFSYVPGKSSPFSLNSI